MAEVKKSSLPKLICERKFEVKTFGFLYFYDVFILPPFAELSPQVSTSSVANDAFCPKSSEPFLPVFILNIKT